jgi:hypothetical protein
MEPSVKQSATGFVDRITNLAHTAAGKPVPETTKESVPLVPIYIGVDRDHEQLREVCSVKQCTLKACTVAELPLFSWCILAAA